MAFNLDMMTGLQLNVLKNVSVNALEAMDRQERRKYVESRGGDTISADFCLFYKTVERSSSKFCQQRAFV